MATARLFVAIDLGPDLKRELAACVQRVRPALPDTKWVQPEAMHLTLAFLGETPLERLEELGTALTAATSGTTPFSCAVKGIGVFPGTRRPAVVWAGIDAGGAPLGLLAQRVREGLAGAGCPSDPHPFAAHVTIGRVRHHTRFRPGVLEETLRPWAAHAFGHLAVDRVSVYSSLLTPAGPVYELQRAFPLARLSP